MFLVTLYFHEQFWFVLVLVFVTFHGTFSSFVNQTTTTTTTSFSMENSTTVLKKLAKYTLQEKLNGRKYMSEIGSRCSEDGFFPDKDDCRKFHVCFSGTQSVRRCKEGMLWDAMKIGCSMQNMTICADGRKKWNLDEDTTGGVSKSIRANYTCRPGANGLFADPSSCSIYHWCVLGILHSTHFCNPGLHFSASASGCVLPKDAECEGQIAPPYSSIECALGSSGYFPDPYDCSVFHYCDGAKVRSEALLCSEGRVWSSKLENCALPLEVPECQNSCPPSYSSQMRFSDPVVCSQYIQCVDGSLQPRTCLNNLFFDRITKTCKPYDQAECHGDKPGSSFIGTTNAPCKSIVVDCFLFLFEFNELDLSSDISNGNSILSDGVNKKRVVPFACIGKLIEI
ncbi:hypothetical protein I4U23_013914 [Adineta vaga]|nr:hypothetical protein I4U23_013914 [Adineta vaga]